MKSCCEEHNHLRFVEDECSGLRLCEGRGLIHSIRFHKVPHWPSVQSFAYGLFLKLIRRRMLLKSVPGSCRTRGSRLGAPYELCLKPCIYLNAGLGSHISPDSYVCRFTFEGRTKPREARRVRYAFCDKNSNLTKLFVCKRFNFMMH